MEEKYIVAIEIGSSKLRGALAAIDPAGLVNVLAVQEEPANDSVRYGQVRNIEEVATAIGTILDKLEKIKAIQPRAIEKVYVGLSGFSVAAASETSAMKFMQETDITAQIIKELKEKAAANHFSDKEIYEIVPIEYTVDHESTQKPIGCVANSISANYKIVEGNAGIKNNIIRVLVDRLKLEPIRYIVTPLAIADCVLTREEKTLGCMLVDFGAETTTTVICKGGALKYLLTLPMGSRNITRDLMSLNYLEDQAESFKRSIGIIPAGQDVRIADQPAISSYIEARASEIVANVLAQIEYAGLQPSDLPSGIIVTGGGSRLKGLSEMIAGQSKMKVRQATAPRSIRLSDTSVLADNSIDIISLLVEAAKNNPVDSLSEVIIPQTPQSTPVEESFYSEDGDFGDDRPRMGVLDDDPIVDDSDFGDEPRQRSNPRGVERQKRQSKNRFTLLKDRVSRIFNSEFDDRFDSEE